MKSIKERNKTIVIEPFGYTVTVIVSNDIHASARKRIPNIEPDANWGAMTATVNNQMHSFIFLPERVNTGTIAHECFHVLWHLMRHIGAEFENEVMAYTLGFIVDEVSCFAKGTKRKVRSKPPSKSGAKSPLRISGQFEIL